jgi:hypothetical protein
MVPLVSLIDDPVIMDLVPPSDKIRPHIIAIEQRLDMLRRLLRLALERETTPEQIARLRGAKGGKVDAR